MEQETLPTSLSSFLSSNSARRERFAWDSSFWERMLGSVRLVASWEIIRFLAMIVAWGVGFVSYLISLLH